MAMPYTFRILYEKERLQVNTWSQFHFWISCCFQKFRDTSYWIIELVLKVEAVLFTCNALTFLAESNWSSKNVLKLNLLFKILRLRVTPSKLGMQLLLEILLCLSNAGILLTGFIVSLPSKAYITINEWIITLIFERFLPSIFYIMK